MKYLVKATIECEVEVDALTFQTELGRQREAESILEAHLDDDDLVTYYGTVNASLTDEDAGA